MTVRRVGIAVVALALLLVACGDAGREPTGAAQGQTDDTTEAFPDLSADQRRCVEEGAEAAGLDPEEVFRDPDAGQERVDFYAIYLECVPNLFELDSYVDVFADTLEATVPGDLDLTTEETRCVLRHVLDNSDDPARTLVAFDRQTDIDIVLDGMFACFSEASLAQIAGLAGTGAQEYGDDARLDGLYDDCRDGNDRGCDILFLIAAEGSDYESVAQSCGGRGRGGNGMCSPEATLDAATGFAPPDSPGLGVLAASCRAGDLTACDLLYQIAPLGSEAETTGLTCGGRLAVAAVPDCRTRLGGG